ncbi:hypothetical protein Glove_46g71 [Diversispora epigaea]|uniref:Protein kinase domain-containing protein n=1 Tax=Diversispora epigaea TaxID=1348612 RepID=A0A397JED4_9GLOM|nr:hypothetical protein Glove_46g71 [Diversispora epigaea]
MKMNQKICKKCEKDILCKDCQKKMVENLFSDWSCGNSELDEYLKKKQIEAIDYSINIPVKWIPSEEFEDIELLKCGGEGKIYSSNWNKGPLNLGKERVALKCLYSSSHDVEKFIKEVNLQVSLCHTNTPLCYGVSRLSLSSTSQYAIVMEYAEDGDLKHYIQTNFKSIGWREKLELMYNISEALKVIHKAKLVHGDLHSGNILRNKKQFYISDLGLCRPYTEINYRAKGVLPYVAPEVLCGKPYGPEADVYGFGMILWEVISGKNPFEPIPHNIKLVQSIINDIRPLIGRNVPNELSELIQKCWSKEPKLRPSADDLHQTFEKWLFDDEKHKIWDELEVEDDDYENMGFEMKGESTRSISLSESSRTVTGFDYKSNQMNFVIPDDFKCENEDSE